MYVADEWLPHFFRSVQLKREQGAQNPAYRPAGDYSLFCYNRCCGFDELMGMEIFSKNFGGANSFSAFEVSFQESFARKGGVVAASAQKERSHAKKPAAKTEPVKVEDSAAEIFDKSTGLKYAPEFWNKDSPFMRRTNCYFYAINVINFEKSQDIDYHDQSYSANPGGLKFADFYHSGGLCKNSKENADKFLQVVKEGARIDGLTYVGENKPHMDKDEEGYLIALYIRPFTKCTRGGMLDFHFIRQDSREPERWSGKNYSKEVSNKDFAGNIISDPKTANFSPYKFIGYFKSPKGGLILPMKR